MENGYQFVWDLSTISFVIASYLIHITFLILQVALALFLILSGIMNLVAYGKEGKISKALGLSSPEPGDRNILFGTLKIVFGVLLLLPGLLGLHFSASLAALILALGYMIYQERAVSREETKTGNVTRKIAITGLVVILAFSLWEGADSIELAKRLLTKARKYQQIELAWQTRTDKKAPKEGEMAPDFELSTPDGSKTVRLSDFRGVKPVALVFGAHT
jgi:uncharacterized membrane protein YphA (DoxX/SURF4 family)